MLRSKEDRDLDRTFGKIETWEEFLKRWEEIDTEQEAIGLLYAAATIPPLNDDHGFSLEEKGRAAEERIKFYLRVANYKNNKEIATVAEQTIIKQMLKKIGPPWYRVYHQGYLNANVIVLEFLQNPSEALNGEPYPKFVSRYLLPLYEVWRHGSRPDYHKSKEYLLFRRYTELIIRSLCAWGLAYVLASDGDAERIPIIKKFLDEKEYDVNEVFMGLSGYGVPPNNLTEKNVLYTAACAYLKLQYWSGDGVRAKFDRLESLQRLRFNLFEK